MNKSCTEKIHNPAAEKWRPLNRREQVRFHKSIEVKLMVIIFIVGTIAALLVVCR